MFVLEVSISHLCSLVIMLPYYMHLNEITSGCLAFRKTPLTLIFLQCLSIIYKTYNVYFALSVMLDRLLVKVYLVGVHFGMKFSFSGRSHDLNILPGNTSCLRIISDWIGFV
jgi:hypothetical protein